jgi:lipocalin
MHAGSNYWVLAVGPMDGEQFEWAVMSDPLSLSLWVLGRNVSTFNNKYKTEVLNLLKERNFADWWNKPGMLCSY